MPVNNDTLNKNLYDALRSRGYDPIPLDSKGDASDEIEKADVFRFSFGQGDEKVNAWATIEGNDLMLYIDDKFTQSKDFEPFTRYMKVWAQRKLLGFETTNKDRLLGDMKKRTVMKQKEQLGEGYYPMGKKASYNDSVPQVKMIIQHTRNLEEGEQRFRNIAKIFVENANGERFLLPTNRPGLARVYARHIAEGGTPYDEKGKHITTLVEEYSKMAGFVRATRNGQFNESALRLVNEGLKHYNDLRMTLQGMASHRGYNKYFESYTPVLNEETTDATSLTELFVQEKLDPRIESVLPILNRLSKNITEMSAVKELEEWATSLAEVEDQTTKTLAEPAEEMLDEAPGAETLAHNQSTEKSNLKAFDLAEDDMEESVKDVMKNVRKKFRQSAIGRAREHGYRIEEGFSDSRDAADQIIDSIGGEEGLTLDDIYRAISEYQTMMDNPHKLDVDEVAEIVIGRLSIEEVDDDNAWFGADEEEEYEHYFKSTEDVEEGLDANQKRAGQLGPTEKVGPKGAVGKLVGASESINYDEDKLLLDRITRLAGK
jgi:hypothetical protein